MFNCIPKLRASIQKARDANDRLNSAAKNAAENWRSKDPQLYHALVASTEGLLDACEELEKVIDVADISGQDVGLDLSVLRWEVRNWRSNANFHGNASKQYNTWSQQIGRILRKNI